MKTFLKVCNKYQNHVLWMYVSAFFDKIHSITKKHDLIQAIKDKNLLELVQRESERVFYD